MSQHFQKLIAEDIAISGFLRSDPYFSLHDWHMLVLINHTYGLTK